MMFILTKTRMIHTDASNYNCMSYKRKKLRIPPQRLTKAEARTCAALVVSTQSIYMRREMVVDLMLSVDSESFRLIYELIGDRIMGELMPSC